jgi:delta-aminolevulinic acid dehydratase/porphobilinogen synthase
MLNGFYTLEIVADSSIFQQRDMREGADIIMVKPALPYLDIISDAMQPARDHPIACYQVSGEFAMIHAGAAAGVYDLRAMRQLRAWCEHWF